MARILLHCIISIARAMGVRAQHGSSSTRRTVRSLRERGLLAGHLTAGAAYGGEGEAITARDQEKQTRNASARLRARIPGGPPVE